MDNEKLNRVEELLKAEAGPRLSGDFTQKVMSRVRRLPDPALLTRATTWRDHLVALRRLGPGEKLGAALVLLGMALAFIPGSAELISGFGWELAGLSVDVNLGSSAVSASLATVATAICCVLLLLGIGAYGTRNKLIVT